MASNTKNVLIVGSSGMVGGLILQQCLAHTKVGRVVSIVRRPSTITDRKLTEIVHDNFLDYSKVEKYFKNIDAVYFCIGVYTGAVARDKFYEITVGYTKAFATILKKHSPQAVFCFLSGQGADRKGKSRLMFAKDKGIAEIFLLAQKLKDVHIFRPAYIYPVVKRKEPNLSYRFSRLLYPLLKRIFPSGVITSTDLANVMFKIGLNGGEKDTYENKDIRKLAGKN